LIVLISGLATKVAETGSASFWLPAFAAPARGRSRVRLFIAGEQTFEIDGVGTKIVKAGEVVYTPPNTKHFGRNATDKLSKTLVIRIKAKDKPVMTEVK